MPGRSGTALLIGFDRLVRGGVRGVWVRGRLPEGPVVWAANHHSWWDGFAAAAVIRADGRTVELLMDAENLAHFGFMRRAGVIATAEPRAALDALRRDSVLVVFPEADLRPPGPLGPLQPGAEWLARRAPAALVAVAMRAVLRGHQWPEIYLDIVDVGTSATLVDVLGGQLARLDAELLVADPRAPLPGFDLVLPGRRSWDERIATWVASVTPRRGGSDVAVGAAAEVQPVAAPPVAAPPVAAPPVAAPRVASLPAGASVPT